MFVTNINMQSLAINRWIILLMVVFVQLNGFAQKQESYGQNVKEVELKAFKKNVTKIALVVGASAITALALDEPVNDFLQRNRSSWSGRYTDGANFFGEKHLIVPVVALSWGTGYLIKDEKLKNTSWNAMKAIATTAVATEVIKISTGRARPYMDEGAYSFNPFSGEEGYKSLPSGHVALAFAAITPYAETYSRWLYFIPASVAFARMYKNKHWFSDTVIGGGLGFVSGYIFAHHPKSKIQVFANGIIAYF